MEPIPEELGRMHAGNPLLSEAREQGRAAGAGESRSQSPGRVVILPGGAPAQGSGYSIGGRGWHFINPNKWTNSMIIKVGTHASFSQKPYIIFTKILFVFQI